MDNNKKIKELKEQLFELENKQTAIKQNLEWSKILTIITTILYILGFILGFIGWIFKDSIPSELLTYVSTQFSVVITCYFTKSCVENYRKIKNNNCENENIVNENNI